MLDMGDFAGGLLKYLRKHPVPRLTIGGGIGKITKLSQGALDLHSARSQADFGALADLMQMPGLEQATSVLHCYEMAGSRLADAVTGMAKSAVEGQLEGTGTKVDVVVIDRHGAILAHAE
jgi:cobalt-precorrin-5B (C1)-methyltransferase